MCAGAISVVLNETRLSMLQDLKSVRYFNSQSGQQPSVVGALQNVQLTTSLEYILTTVMN